MKEIINLKKQKNIKRQKYRIFQKIHITNPLKLEQKHFDKYELTKHPQAITEARHDLLASRFIESKREI